MVIFAKIEENQVFRKKAKFQSIFKSRGPNNRIKFLGHQRLCMKNFKHQKPAKQVGGIFFYLPILLYNTIGEFSRKPRAQTCSPDRRSGLAHFRTQSAFMAPLLHKLHKNINLKNLDPLLGFRHFCQN